MRIIKINADEQKIEVLDDIETKDGKTLDCATCAALIGNQCEVVTSMGVRSLSGFRLILDDCGLIRGIEHGFRMAPCRVEISGNAILTWVDSETGQWVGIPGYMPDDLMSRLISLLEEYIEWFDWTSEMMKTFDVYTLNEIPVEKQ